MSGTSPTSGQPLEPISIHPNSALDAGDVSSDSEGAAPAPLPAEPRANRSSSRRRAGSRTRAESRTRTHDYASDYEGGPRLGSMRSSRPLRYREGYDDEDDYYRREDGRYWRERDEDRHPDYRSSSRRPRTYSRPPRAYLNSANEQEVTTPKTLVEERRSFHDPYSPGFKGGRMYDEELGFGYGPYGDGSSPRDGPGTTFTGNTATNQIDFKNLTPEQRAEVLRLPWMQWMSSSFKNHFVASMGEFIGTTMFLFFAFAGTEVANIGSKVSSDSSSGDAGTTTGGATGFNVGVLMYISLCFGFSLMVNVWVFFRISGGLFNPAVTLAMLLVRAIPPARAACLFVAQMCGGLLASVIVRFLFPENFNVRTTLGGGASIVQGIFIEAVLTAELVFTIFMLAKEKHRATFIAPVGIGLALFIAELVGVQFTGGSLNPARSFGPCAVTATFDSEHWIYWVGPLLGSLLAVVFYKFIKMLEYEMANPGADGDPNNDPTVNPEKRAEVRNSRS